MSQVELKNKANREREEALRQWFCHLPLNLLKPDSNESNTELVPVSGDASFRRYFRNLTKEGFPSYILVDAPPDKEDSLPFVTVAKRFLDYGIKVPVVYEVDYKVGFMCLSDFGDVLLFEKLDNSSNGSEKNEPTAEQLYHLAFEQLLRIQDCPVDENFVLPKFDAAMLHREMSLFQEWFCEGLLGLKLSAKESELIEYSFQFLINSAISQTQVCVHRDYHSRNLLFQQDSSLAVIDFQDAVLGPFSYDLVSLLKDCYIKWPRAQVNVWALGYARLALKKNIISELNEASFLKSFDLMGMQRHLKVLGIFSRLYLRDKRTGYLPDIPRTLSYITEILDEHSELNDFSQWLASTVTPHVESRVQGILSQENIP